MIVRLLPTAWKWLDPRDRERDQEFIFDIPQKDVILFLKIKLSKEEMNTIHCLERGVTSQPDNVNYIYRSRTDIVKAGCGKRYLTNWIPIIMMIIRKIKLSDSTEEIEMI